MIRWRATAYYRTESGEPLDVTWELETLADLGRLDPHPATRAITEITIEAVSESAFRTVEEEVEL